MKHLYYQAFDCTRKPSDPNFAHFWHLPINNDFAGVVTSFAKHNGVPPTEIRLFFYETKAQYERAESEWRRGVDWNIPLLP